MTPEASGTSRGFAIVGRIAKLLRSDRRPAEAVLAAADLLRQELPAQAVTVWLREPGGSAFHALPSASPRIAETLEALPPLGPGSLRHPLTHDGKTLGVLEAVGGGENGERDEILEVVADLFAPFLAAVELSEDLAYEVAVRTREVEEQRLFTSLIIDCLPVGLYVVDRDYRIQIWNRKREMGDHGVRRDAVLGRQVFEILTRQVPERLKAEFDEVFESGKTSVLEVEVPVESDIRFYRISKIPMCLDEDRVTHVITVGEDVTEWRAIQQQILQSEKLAAVGQLAAGVMHEINNPLATIGACVAAMEGRFDEISGPAEPVLREYAEIIDKEVERCTRIVEGLLDFSRPKGKAMRPVDVNALVGETLFLLKHHDRFKRLTVKADLATDTARVLGNREQLIQVFMALMLNALDAMEHGNGTLTVRTGAGGVRRDEVVVEFEDTGSGIPRAELTKIFEPFYTTKPQGRGTGLGLSICYGIVEQHRGRLEVESQPGWGSTFRVFLPVPAEGDTA